MNAIFNYLNYYNSCKLLLLVSSIQMMERNMENVAFLVL